MRREQRWSLALPVRVCGMDADGKMFAEDATTVDVTTTGARIRGLTRALHRGCIVSVQRGDCKANYRVLWRTEANGQEPAQTGLQLIDTGLFIWGQVLPRVFGDNYRRDNYDGDNYDGGRPQPPNATQPQPSAAPSQAENGRVE